MNLVLDNGNSFCKWAVFKNNTLIENGVLTIVSEELLTLAKKHTKIENIILSDVGKFDYEQKVVSLFNQSHFIRLNEIEDLPFVMGYDTPHTLGQDRIGLVAAAVNSFSKKNTLIIDAGTCITYDFKDENNNYLGGAISPGVNLRFQALKQFTKNLPLVTHQSGINEIGTNTVTSINSGVFYGVLYEIEGRIEQFIKKHENFKIILTGGHHNLFAKQIKFPIFVNSLFLLEGLNFLLNNKVKSY